MKGVRCRSCIWYQGDWCDKKHDDPDPDLERDCEHYCINTTAVTICTNCLRLKQGLCDGEKELTACPSYKRMTNADCIRAYTDEQIAEMLSHFNCPASEHGCSDCYTFKGDCKQCWLDWLQKEVTDNG